MPGRELKIDIIRDGIVIDHIKSGNCMKIFNYLNLAELDCTVAILGCVVCSAAVRSTTPSCTKAPTRAAPFFSKDKSFMDTLPISLRLLLRTIGLPARLGNHCLGTGDMAK